MDGNTMFNGVIFVCLVSFIIYVLFFYGTISGENAWCEEHGFDGLSWIEDTCYVEDRVCRTNPAGKKRCVNEREYEHMFRIEMRSNG